MSNILDTIIKDKVREVEQRKRERSEEDLVAAVEGLAKCRNFYSAVTKENVRGVNVIAEVKKASPSEGVIRADFNAAAIAHTYQNCGADAISVLTDEKYFQGKLEFIAAIKDAVDLPILRKDFIVDKYQVYESRVAGADAILLITEVLKPADLMDFLILANQLTMTAIIEVHGADTLLAMRSLVGFPQEYYNVIGINNRDLTTMEVDINTTARLAELAGEGRRVVAESGIKTRGDVEKMIKVGVGAILIGTALCGSGNIEKKFAELFGARTS